jgi:ankyrin repeat protein
LPKGSGELPELDDVSHIERNPRCDGAVLDAVETKSKNWLAAALLAGGDPNGNPDGNARHLLNRTPLCFAANSGQADGVRLLLQFGANPNKEGRFRMTALWEGSGYPRIVALLLRKGADPNAGSMFSCDHPLICAARAKSIESMRLMLVHGGDASRVDFDGRNVLHHALRNTSAECCRELLAHGADACGHGGLFVRETPMRVVAGHAGSPDGPERVKILDLLLEAGASVLAVDEFGFTAGQLVRRCEASKEVLEWFAQHGTLVSV